MKLKSFLEKWIEGDLRTGGLSNGTVDSYIRIAKRIEKHYIGYYDVRAITTDDLQQYIDLLMLGGIAPDGAKFKGYSKDYVHLYSAVLNHCFTYAVYPIHERDDNPMQFIRIKKKRIIINLFDKDDDTENLYHIVTKKEIKNIVAYLDEHKRHASTLPILISYYTGLRLGEVCGLCWEDIDMEEKFITVKRSVHRNNEHKCIEVGPTKNGKPRIVDFGETLYNIFLQYLDEQQIIRSTLGKRNIRNYVWETTLRNRKYYYLESTTFKNKKDDIMLTKNINLVCIKNNGAFVNPDMVADACRVISRELPGLEGFHFHTLRHTYTSNLLSLGATPKDVQELLGHADIRTTMNIYAHAKREDKKKTVRLLDNL